MHPQSFYKDISVEFEEGIDNALIMYSAEYVDENNLDLLSTNMVDVRLVNIRDKILISMWNSKNLKIKDNNDTRNWNISALRPRSNMSKYGSYSPTDYCTDHRIWISKQCTHIKQFLSNNRQIHGTIYLEHDKLPEDTSGVNVVINTTEEMFDALLSI